MLGALEADEARARFAEVVRRVEDDTRAQHREDGTRPARPDKIRRLHPHAAPQKSSWSPQPIVIARTPKRRRALWKAVAEVVAAYWEAAERLANGERDVRFPEGMFPPGLPYVPTSADLLAPG